MSEIFNYRMAELVRGLTLGSHKSRQRGTGSDFYKKSSFLSEPDTSRIDLNASLIDPFENLYVRSYRQSSRIKVLLLIDGSSSMLFGDKPKLVLECFSSVINSVKTVGDECSAFLLGERIERHDTVGSLAASLSNLQPEQNRAEAFNKIGQVLPNRPALVFLISDFHWSHTKLKQVMSMMSQHTVIPVIMWRSTESYGYPLWRFIELYDLESGHKQLVFITPAQKKRIEEAHEQRKIYLNQQFRAFNSQPFWLVDQYSAKQMNRYFMMR